MRSTSLLRCAVWLCCTTLLVLASSSSVTARQQRPSSLRNPLSHATPTSFFDSLPPEQQRIRLDYLLPAYLDMPYLPIPSLSSPLPPLVLSSQPPPACPCSNATLCRPLSVAARPELFIFQVNTTGWPHYDFSSLTTIVLASSTTNHHLDPALLCYAHARSVRLVLISSPSASFHSNASYSAAYINHTVHAVLASHTDGVNVDFEEPLNATEAAVYVKLVKQLGEQLREQVGKAVQLTVDVAWSPNCIDGRCYDAVGLAAACDFLFVMSYDLRSQVFDLSDCQASANSPIALVEAGLRNYTQMGISAQQLVLGVPWSAAAHTHSSSTCPFPARSLIPVVSCECVCRYAYVYSCLPGTAKDAVRCPIEAVPFRGAPCSDAAGEQVAFAEAVQLLQRSTTGRQWNATYDTAWFNYVDEQQTVRQVWLDDVESLVHKYSLAKSMGLRGVGMWTADFLDYDTQPISNTTHAMWTALQLAFTRDSAQQQQQQQQQQVGESM